MTLLVNGTINKVPHRKLTEHVNKAISESFPPEIAATETLIEAVTQMAIQTFEQNKTFHRAEVELEFKQDEDTIIVHVRTFTAEYLAHLGRYEEFKQFVDSWKRTGGTLPEWAEEALANGWLPAPGWVPGIPELELQ